ncbi:MAG: hypothetical protein C5B49_06370 [Bdellovibrio sp.]|nr:MAG: hypothetical protein C5B49_06370 [Bdellovibrio sp.]
MKTLDGKGRESRSEDSTVESLTFFQRFLQGTRTGGLFFLLAIVSFFVPILHFVLVPSFLIASLALGIQEFRKMQILHVRHFDCTSCGHAVETDKPFREWPVRLKCPACQIDLWFEKE